MKKSKNASQQKTIIMKAKLPKMPENVIQVFLARETFDRLQEVTAYHGLKPSEYARIAVRSYKKHAPDLSTVTLPPTTGGTPMRFALRHVERPDVDTFRKILIWMLSRETLTPRPPPRIDPRDLQIMGGLI